MHQLSLEQCTLHGTVYMESIVKPFEPSMLCLVFKAFFLQAFEINVYNILEEVQRMQESIKTLEEKVKSVKHYFNNTNRRLVKGH